MVARGLPNVPDTTEDTVTKGMVTKARTYQIPPRTPLSNPDAPKKPTAAPGPSVSKYGSANTNKRRLKL